MNRQRDEKSHTAERDLLIDLYRQMLTIRRVEEAAAKAYAQGKIGGFLHLGIGQEGVCVGAVRVAVGGLLARSRALLCRWATSAGTNAIRNTQCINAHAPTVDNTTPASAPRPPSRAYSETMMRPI